MFLTEIWAYYLKLSGSGQALFQLVKSKMSYIVESSTNTSLHHRNYVNVERAEKIGGEKIVVEKIRAEKIGAEKIRSKYIVFLGESVV